MTGETVASGDPWIDGYLIFRQAVLNGKLRTEAEAEAYARELRRTFPNDQPSVPAAMFITADIAITFPEHRHVALMTALWIPAPSGRGSREGNPA